MSNGPKSADDNSTPPDNSSKIKDLLENATAFVDTAPKHAEDQWATLPYAQGTVFNRRDQNRHFERTKIDPAETSIVLFPGQGSQFVGMAKSLTKYPEATDLFEMASEILRFVFDDFDCERLTFNSVSGTLCV